MNYQELAQLLNRPYNTIRKWRSEVTSQSGYEFTRIKVRNGRGGKNRTTYDFNEKEVEKFSQLTQLLQNGTSKVEAITQCFGNIEQEKREKLEEESQKLIQIQSKTIHSLLQQEKILQRQLTTLNEKVSVLTHRVESLENKGFLPKFKMKK